MRLSISVLRDSPPFVPVFVPQEAMSDHTYITDYPDLDIGPGPVPCGGPSTITLDADPLAAVDFPDVAWGDAPLPFVSGSIGRIYASHVLEHVHWAQVPYALAEAWRVLIPGGTIELWVPDFAVIARDGLSDSDYPAEAWKPLAWMQHNMDWANGRLFCGIAGGKLNVWQQHRSCFTYTYLAHRLAAAGFAASARLASPPAQQTICHDYINLGIRGQKPAACAP